MCGTFVVAALGAQTGAAVFVCLVVCQCVATSGGVKQLTCTMHHLLSEPVKNK